VNLDPNTETWGFENSMSDLMEIVDSPAPNVYLMRYTSSHGGGDSTVRIFGTTRCGASFESTAVLTIIPIPPTAVLTSTPGATCGATVTATLKGAAPFTGRWSDTGETFTTNDTTVTHFVRNTQYVGLQITDATTLSSFSNYLYVETTPMSAIYLGAPYLVCRGATATVNAYGVPEGAQVTWSLQGASGRIVSGQGTTELVVEGVEVGWFTVSASYRTTDGCDSNVSTPSSILVPAPASNPVITLASNTIAAGEGTDVTIAFDSVAGFEGVSWETSNGDALYLLNSDAWTFTLRYVSQNGPGTSTIRAYGTTYCGQTVESTATITITP